MAILKLLVVLIVFSIKTILSVAMFTCRTVDKWMDNIIDWKG